MSKSCATERTPLLCLRTGLNSKFLELSLNLQLSHEARPTVGAEARSSKSSTASLHEGWALSLELSQCIQRMDDFFFLVDEPNIRFSVRGRDHVEHLKGLPIHRTTLAAVGGIVSEV